MQVETVGKNSWRMDEDNIVIGFCHIYRYIGDQNTEIYLLSSLLIRMVKEMRRKLALRLKADMLLILHALP